MGKRFPDDYTRQELVSLIHHHHSEHIEAKTKLADLTEKHIKVSKELSKLRRGK